MVEARTKEGCGDYLLRNVPLSVKDKWKEKASSEGLSLRAWLITVATRAANEG